MKINKIVVIIKKYYNQFPFYQQKVIYDDRFSRCMNCGSSRFFTRL